jgi:hypothetical protein
MKQNHERVDTYNRSAYSRIQTNAESLSYGGDPPWLEISIMMMNYTLRNKIVSLW